MASERAVEANKRAMNRTKPDTRAATVARRVQIEANKAAKALPDGVYLIWCIGGGPDSKGCWLECTDNGDGAESSPIVACRSHADAVAVIQHNAGEEDYDFKTEDFIIVKLP